ncbi:MAG: hypothetical protein K6G11_08255, partial [Lachnospiraceae bacterium]|nr:hypothetical protein [Lachnospiraceae bacterium]
MAKYCLKCGKKNDSSVDKCINCGTPFKNVNEKKSFESQAGSPNGKYFNTTNTYSPKDKYFNVTSGSKAAGAGQTGGPTPTWTTGAGQTGGPTPTWSAGASKTGGPTPNPAYNASKTYSPKDKYFNVTSGSKAAGAGQTGGPTPTWTAGAGQTGGPTPTWTAGAGQTGSPTPNPAYNASKTYQKNENNDSLRNEFSVADSNSANTKVDLKSVFNFVRVAAVLLILLTFVPTFYVKANMPFVSVDMNISVSHLITGYTAKDVYDAGLGGTMDKVGEMGEFGAFADELADNLIDDVDIGKTALGPYPFMVIFILLPIIMLIITFVGVLDKKKLGILSVFPVIDIIAYIVVACIIYGGLHDDSTNINVSFGFVLSIILDIVLLVVLIKNFRKDNVTDFNDGLPESFTSGSSNYINNSSISGNGNNMADSVMIGNVEHISSKRWAIFGLVLFVLQVCSSIYSLIRIKGEMGSGAISYIFSEYKSMLDDMPVGSGAAIVFLSITMLVESIFLAIAFVEIIKTEFKMAKYIPNLHIFNSILTAGVFLYIILPLTGMYGINSDVIMVLLIILVSVALHIIMAKMQKMFFIDPKKSKASICIVISIILIAGGMDFLESIDMIIFNIAMYKYIKEETKLIY